MVDPDRRPTAQEIEELIDLVRRDPGSPAFIDLGEAYLALGRPRDAIQVGNLGLEASPDSLEGRVMRVEELDALSWRRRRPQQRTKRATMHHAEAGMRVRLKRQRVDIVSPDG